MKNRAPARYSTVSATRGTLVDLLLPRHGGTSRPFYLLHPHVRHLPLRVRMFVDFLTAQFRPAPHPR